MFKLLIESTSIGTGTYLNCVGFWIRDPKTTSKRIVCILAGIYHTLKINSDPHQH
jgi:hypothetical protein